MRTPLIVMVLALAVQSTPSPADIIGWCLPGDGCMGPEPLTPKGFNTCEERCEMKNPTAVRGMNATLFDVECRGDSSSFDYRLLFVEFTDFDGRQRALVIGRYGPEPLEKCR